MWVRLESNTIKEILTRPKALTIGDINYPSNIFSMWTEAELAVIGIVPITMDYTNRKDNLWYINTAINYAYDTETGVATGSCLLYTSPSPRDVEESRMPSSA